MRDDVLISVVSACVPFLPDGSKVWEGVDLAS